MVVGGKGESEVSGGVGEGNSTVAGRTIGLFSREKNDERHTHRRFPAKSGAVFQRNFFSRQKEALLRIQSRVRYHTQAGSWRSRQSAGLGIPKVPGSSPAFSAKHVACPSPAVGGLKWGQDFIARLYC